MLAGGEGGGSGGGIVRWDVQEDGGDFRDGHFGLFGVLLVLFEITSAVTLPLGVLGGGG